MRSVARIEKRSNVNWIFEGALYPFGHKLRDLWLENSWECLWKIPQKIIEFSNCDPGNRILAKCRRVKISWKRNYGRESFESLSMAREVFCFFFPKLLLNSLWKFMAIQTPDFGLRGNTIYSSIKLTRSSPKRYVFLMSFLVLIFALVWANSHKGRSLFHWTTSDSLAWQSKYE